MADAEPYKVCLDTGSYGTGGQVAAVGLPIVLTLVIVGSFLSWQLKARSALPVARLVPDLEGAVEAPSRVKCLIFNWMPGGLKAPCFTLPFFPKPLEYIGSGVWTGFVFTWPYQPRFAEPLMTNTGRESVALVLIAIQLMFFMGLGGLATAVIEWATESAAGDGSAAADGEAEEENDDKKVYLELALGLCNIYVVSIVQAVFKMVLMMIYGPAAEKGGTYVTGVAVTAAAFFAGCTSSIVSVLNLYSCADFWNVFLFPFLLKQPLSLLAGPLAFIFLVSFGSGASIEDILEVYKTIDGMSEAELRQRLTELGQGPFIAGGPIWNLDKVTTEEELAAVRQDVAGGSTDSESLDLLSTACLRKTDWSQAEMGALLKRCVYTLEAGQFFASIDKFAVGSYAKRTPLYPGWGTGGGSSPDGGYSLDRAALLNVIAELAEVAEGNMNHPWSIPAADLISGELDATQYSDDIVRVACRELMYFKMTTIPSMWEGKASGAESEFASPISDST